MALVGRIRTIREVGPTELEYWQAIQRFDVLENRVGHIETVIKGF